MRNRPLSPLVKTSRSHSGSRPLTLLIRRALPPSSTSLQWIETLVVLRGPRKPGLICCTGKVHIRKFGVALQTSINEVLTSHCDVLVIEFHALTYLTMIPPCHLCKTAQLNHFPVGFHMEGENQTPSINDSMPRSPGKLWRISSGLKLSLITSSISTMYTLFPDEKL